MARVLRALLFLSPDFLAKYLKPNPPTAVVALEDVVEGLVSEYEQLGRGSALYKVVESAIRLTDPEKGLQSDSLQLLATTATLFHKKRAPHRRIFEYLNWRLPQLHEGGQHDNLYRQVTPNGVIDELYVVFYLLGWLPRIVNGEKIRLNNSEALKLMSIASASLGGEEVERREDSRFYSLVWRVSQRHIREIGAGGPLWTDLVGQVLKFQPLMSKYRPVESFRYFMETRYNFDRYIVERLRQYLAGERPVETEAGLVFIEPLKNLELLRRVNIEKGRDISLKDLLSAVTYSEKNGGKSWIEYQDLAGRLADVEAFHSIQLNHRIIMGKPNEDDDYVLLKAIVLGKVPVTYKGRRRRFKEREDLYMAIGFIGDSFRNTELCAEELIPVFRRARTRYEQHRGLSPAELMAKVLSDEGVVDKLGCTTPEQVYCLLVVHQLKEYLRPRVVGRFRFVRNGEKVLLGPGENLEVLRPQSRAADPVLKRTYHQLWARRGLFDEGYWDIVEQEFARPKAVAYHGKAQTRRDISPYASAAVGEAPMKAVGAA